MSQGINKDRYIKSTGQNEAAYYAWAKLISEKRHFNIRTAQILNAYGLTVRDFLKSQECENYPEHYEYWSAADRFQWLIQDCKCAMKLIRAYVSEDSGAEAICKFDHIADYLRKFPEDSFYRFGDRNQVDKKFIKEYCKPDGLPIDVQAQEMTEMMGRGLTSWEITPDDIVEFCVAHPRGSHTYKRVTRSQLIEESFYQLVGFRLTADYAFRLLEQLDGKPVITEDVPF